MTRRHIIWKDDFSYLWETSEIPKNLTFDIADLTSRTSQQTYLNKFDFVHARAVEGGFKNKFDIIPLVLNMTKPGSESEAGGSLSSGGVAVFVNPNIYPLNAAKEPYELGRYQEGDGQFSYFHAIVSELARWRWATNVTLY